MDHIGTFASLVIQDWFARVGGVVLVVTALVEIVIEITAKGPPWRIPWRKWRAGVLLAGVALLFVGAYRAWDDQYTLNIQGQQPVATIPSIHCVPWPQKHTTFTLATIWIRNPGPPSVFSDFVLTVYDMTHRQTVTAPTNALSGAPMVIRGSNGLAFVQESDMIIDKVASTPIAQGGAQQGLLFSALPNGVRCKDISLITTKVRFVDVNGKVRETQPITKVVTQSSINYTPGIAGSATLVAPAPSAVIPH